MSKKKLYCVILLVCLLCCACGKKEGYNALSYQVTENDTLFICDAEQWGNSRQIKLSTVNKSGIVTNYAAIVVGDWTHYGDKWYYYDADMNPYIGVKTINGVKYYFNYGQLAEYLDEVVTSGDTLAYVRDGKVIEKTKFKDNELIYLNGNCY